MQHDPMAGADSWLAAADADYVDAFVIDINGLARGKRLNARSWPQAARSGVAFSASALVLDASGTSQGPAGLGTSDGNPDATGHPVPGGMAPVPWARAPTAQCLLAMRDAAGQPLWYDTRHVLQRVVDLCRADGLHPVLSCELEFYLVGADAAGRAAPLARTLGGLIQPASGHLGLQYLEDHADFLHGLHAALRAQAIPADGLVAEYGPGQFELNLLHGPDPVRAADQAVLQRRATHGVAQSRGLRASFMAKPFARHAGSGLHVHVSMTDTAGKNRFGDDGGDSLLHAAIAGLQRLHAQSMALFAPNFSAYRRYRAGEFASLSSAWGYDNRSVAFRVPRSPPAARRVEHRVAAADASPHLVVAAILAGMHHGITNALEPTAPATGDADSQADAGLPRDIFSALHLFRKGAELARYLPENFAAMYCALKRSEAADLFAEVQRSEHDFYL